MTPMASYCWLETSTCSPSWRSSKTPDSIHWLKPPREDEMSWTISMSPGLLTTASSIKTDHKAIVATDCRRVTSRHKHPTAVNFRRRTPTQHAALLRLLSDYDFNHILSNEDTQAAWDQFYADALSHLDKIYPMRQATMTSADPPFLTPEIKSLLRKKNRLMRKGHIEQASALAARIGIKITKANNKHLTGLNSRTGTAELWRAVNTVLKKPRSAGDDVGVT